MAKNISIVGQVFCAAIKIYQFTLGLVMKPSCRFFPSCSEYAALSIQHHGVVNGIWLAVKRLLKCHPWSKVWGVDPVLPNRKEKL